MWELLSFSSLSLQDKKYNYLGFAYKLKVFTTPTSSQQNYKHGKLAGRHARDRHRQQIRDNDPKFIISLKKTKNIEQINEMHA